MSVVAPISACGAVVPVFAAFALGEPPSPLAAAGILAAFAGIILVSRPSEGTPHPSGRPGFVLALSLGAAFGFGFFFVILDRATAAGVSPLWATGGARLGSIPTLLALHAVLRQRPVWPGRRLPAIAGVGIADTTANLLFAIAATLGNLGVVAVLGSLYPVVPVLLARFLLGERLARLQAAGVALALAGVVFMSVG
jgi:drug/metabolite transporter (DMT)-like permease